MRTMTNHSWVDEFPGAVTVCDPEGIILEMNQKSAENFKDDGGMELIGKNMFDCHPEPARTKTRELLEKKRLNFYTTEKKGVHKLIIILHGIRIILHSVLSVPVSHVRPA